VVAVPVNSYQDLKVWQVAMDLAADIYKLTRAFPKEELYGMSSQLRRSAGSIAANIAEGYGREVRGSFVQFLRIAQGSLKETETHLLLAERVGLVERKQIEVILQNADELGRMLRSFIRSLQRKVADS
jgi:four helix bundle protein